MIYNYLEGQPGHRNNLFRWLNAKAQTMPIWTRTRKVFNQLARRNLVRYLKGCGLRLLHNLVKLSSFFRETVAKITSRTFFFMLHAAVVSQVVQKRRHGRAKKSRENVAAQKSRPNMSGSRD